MKQYKITYFGIFIKVDSVSRQYFMDNIFVFENCPVNLMISYTIVDTTCGIKDMKRM